jgi:hypothetical protein
VTQTLFGRMTSTLRFTRSGETAAGFPADASRLGRRPFASGLPDQRYWRTGRAYPACCAILVDTPRVDPHMMSHSDELPDWLRGDPIAEELHARGLPVTKAAWLEAAYGTRSEAPLTYDKDIREWVNRHFPRDPDEPVS